MGLFYTVPDPDEALVITGGLGATTENVLDSMKIVTGRGAFHVPGLHKVNRFYIGSHYVRFEVEAQSAQNIAVNVEATVVFRVSNVHSSIATAAIQFSSADRNAMSVMASDIFSGQTRAIVGGMSVEDIISDRDKLNQDVLESAEPKMSVLGLRIDNFQINQISDNNNHIANLSKPELEKVRQRAEIAQAETDSSIEEARQQAAREKSLYKKETDLQVSENTIETAAKRAEAEQSAPLAEAEAKIKVAKQEKLLLEAQAEAEEARLKVDIITVAEAEAEATRIRSEAEADAIKRKAEALASNNGIALQEELLNKLPEITESFSNALSSSNLTVFNGAEGVTDMMTKAVTMGASILNNTDLKGLNDKEEENPKNLPQKRSPFNRP